MLVKCKNCNKEFDKLPNQIRKHPNHFCSRSCAQSYNNKIRPKRLPIERTCSCGNNFIPKLKSSRILCESCQKSRMNSDKYKAMTLKEYHSKLSVKGKHPSWLNSHIRILNRQWNKELIKQPCSNCSYDKHVELCHVKAITSFPETATLGEVNAPDNNKVLCRNCHWEFDHELLSLETIQK